MSAMLNQMQHIIFLYWFTDRRSYPDERLKAELPWMCVDLSKQIKFDFEGG